MSTKDGKGKGRPLQARWCDAVTADTRLGGTDVTVAWRLASYANADGTNAYPTNLTLARECRLTVSKDPKLPDKGGRSQAVERALKRLLAMGYLERTRHPKDDRRWAYRLTFPCTATPVSRDRGCRQESDPSVDAKHADFQEVTQDEPRSPATTNPGLQGPATNPGTNPGDSAPAERAHGAASQAPDQPRPDASAWVARIRADLANTTADRGTNAHVIPMRPSGT